MIIKIELDLDEEYKRVLKDISLTPHAVQPMGGAWGFRAERLALLGLITMSPLGGTMKYSLTKAGKDALRQLEA